jgi:hypothetical protein
MISPINHFFFMSLNSESTYFFILYLAKFPIIFKYIIAHLSKYFYSFYYQTALFFRCYENRLLSFSGILIILATLDLSSQFYLLDISQTYRFLYS